jgi:NhaA family Na+:H+ antiporter
MADERPGPRTFGGLPEEPVDRMVAPLVRFLHVEAASGVLLLIFTIAALLLANSPFSEQFLSFWKFPIGIHIGGFDMTHSLKLWINDALMAIFFFVVGLEVKRELVLGELRDAQRAALPVAAALGGMLVPAAIYLSLQLGEAGAHGWGIPMATDIAFVVGCMALLGPRVPRGLRIMLVSLAIADDIGAILVIAIGYTEHLEVSALLIGLSGIGIVSVFQRIGVRSVGIYVVLGVMIWFGFHESGIHPTIAGVILGLMTPAYSRVGDNVFSDSVSRLSNLLHGEGWRPDHAERHATLRTVEQLARETLSPLERLEMRLHSWSSFFIMPLFAFANAGVPLELSYFGSGIGIAVTLGLVVGKPIGILLFSWLAVRLGIGRLPDGVGWPAIAGGGMLAGIGFTMALFIAELALDGSQLFAAKVGVLTGSAVAAVAGMALMTFAASKASPVREAAAAQGNA